jgi:YggT family protein
MDSNSYLSQVFLVLQESLLMFFKFYNFLITLRLTITWFPNLNPFTQPFYLLSKITDPYLRLFRGLVPQMFGMDLSPILAILWIECLTEIINELSVN